MTWNNENLTNFLRRMSSVLFNTKNQAILSLDIRSKNNNTESRRETAPRRELRVTSSNLHDNLPNTSISVVAVEVVVAKVALIILLTEGPSIVPGI